MTPFFTELLKNAVEAPAGEAKTLEALLREALSRMEEGG